MKEYSERLKQGEIGVIPTDTLYGLVCSVFSKDAVERLYAVKGRDENKPCIVLIGSISDLEIFGVVLSPVAQTYIQKFWPGKVSVILPTNNTFDYLTRNASTLAFRLPDKQDLLDLLQESGPLIAPSANLQGMPPAKNIAEAKNYFGNQIDFYIDQGELLSLPSTLVDMQNDRLEVIREGAVPIPADLLVI